MEKFIWEEKEFSKSVSFLFKLIENDEFKEVDDEEFMLEVDPVKLFSFEGMDWDEKVNEPTEDEVRSCKI